MWRVKTPGEEGPDVVCLTHQRDWAKSNCDDRGGAGPQRDASPRSAQSPSVRNASTAAGRCQPLPLSRWRVRNSASPLLDCRFVALTQVELAQRILVTQPSVSEIERGESPVVPNNEAIRPCPRRPPQLTAVFDDGRRIPLDV